MKKVIVTGGAGFIGSHLADELLRRGYYVTILDDLSTGKMENITLLLKNENLEFIEGNITDLPRLRKLFQGVDYIFHMAAIASVPRSIDNPELSHEVNATGTLKVLIAARDSGVKKVVFASSSAVYGDTPVQPKTEDMTPDPQSPYAVTKLMGEHYCHIFHNIWELPTVSLRYFNVYGPGQDSASDYAAVIPKFIEMISQGKPPVIFGDGEQTRDFTYITDVARATILAVESQATGVFNIGNGESTSIEQLAQLSIEIIGKAKNLKPVHTDPRPGDIVHSIADTTRASGFGYKPQYSLEEGLRETVSRLQVSPSTSGN
ncbi:MAG: SDR family oxidoreductase [Dehalococcoidales bacterium]|nr:SDR family oxidoreductase [Dehalococcoidales bacterium]